MLTHIRFVQLGCGSWPRFVSYPVAHRWDGATATVEDMGRDRDTHRLPGRCPKGECQHAVDLLAPVSSEAPASRRASLRAWHTFQPNRSVAPHHRRSCQRKRPAQPGALPRQLAAPASARAPPAPAKPRVATPRRADHCPYILPRATPATAPAVRMAQPPHSGHRYPRAAPTKSGAAPPRPWRRGTHPRAAAVHDLPPAGTVCKDPGGSPAMAHKQNKKTSARRQPVGDAAAARTRPPSPRMGGCPPPRGTPRSAPPPPSGHTRQDSHPRVTRPCPHRLPVEEGDVDGAPHHGVLRWHPRGRGRRRSEPFAVVVVTATRRGEVVTGAMRRGEVMTGVTRRGEEVTG